MTTRSRLAALLVAGALGASGCGGDDAVAPASLAPASSPVFVEATVRPDGDVRADLEAAARKVLGADDVRTALARLAGPLLDRKGLDFARDVEPWLGETAALALTRTAGERPDGLAIVATTDEDAALAAVRKGEPVTDREHRGVAYGVTRDGHASAVVEGSLLAGTEPAVRAAIDVAEGGAAPLADSGRFQRAREDADAGDAPGFLFVDVERVLRIAAERASATNPQAALLLSAADTAGLETLGVAFEADARALRVRGALRSERPLPSGDGDAAAALAGAPADSVVAVGLADVGGTVQDAIGSLGGLLGVGLQGALDQLRREGGLDVQRDLLAWMGDARVYVRGTSLADATGALVVASKDRAASRAALPRIARFLASRGVAVRETRVEGADRAYALGASLPVVLAGGGDRVVLGVGRGAAADALAGRGARLGEDGRFRAAAGLLGDDVRPTAFADPAALAALAGRAGGEAGAVLSRLGAAVAGGRADGELSRFEGLVALR